MAVIGKLFLIIFKTAVPKSLSPAHPVLQISFFLSFTLFHSLVAYVFVQF